MERENVIREFERIGALRVRLIGTRNGHELDVREYVSTPDFEGFTRRGIRLDAAERVALLEILATIDRPAKINANARPVAPKDTASIGQQLADRISPAKGAEYRAAAETLNRFPDAIDRPNPAPTRSTTAKPSGSKTGPAPSSVLPPQLAELRERMRKGETVNLSELAAVMNAPKTDDQARASAVLAVASPSSPAFLEGQRLDRAWVGLRALGIDPAHECPDCGEGWQYMGPAVEGHAQAFRHRCGGGHGERRCVNVRTPEAR